MRGIVRQVDDFGRVTIPADYRRYLNLNIKDFVEICITDDDNILIKLNKESEEQHEKK